MLFNPNKFEYDAATEKILQTLSHFDVDWPQVFAKKESIPDIEPLLNAHFEALNELTMPPSELRLTQLRFIKGDWSAAHEIRQLVVYGSEVPVWRSMIDQVTTTAESVLSNDYFDLIKPPIFSEIGLVNIVNPLLADRSLIPVFLDELQKEIAWDFMCDVEQFCHSALVLDLTALAIRNRTYEHLANLYRQAFFPIGFWKGEFVVFNP